MRRFVPSLLLAIAVAACAPERETILLARLDPAQPAVDSVLGPVVARPVGLHRFAEGWAPPGEEAILAVGKRSTVDLTLLGRDHRLRMSYTTHPDLLDQGYRGHLELNGARFADLSPRPGWGRDTLVVELPAGLVREGANRLTVVSSAHLPGNGPGEPGWALYVEWIRIEGRLTGDERERWQEWTAPPPAPESPFVRIPGEVDPHAARPRPGPEAPDVLLVVLDALRADHTGCFGYPRDTTPHLDRLAGEGVRLGRVFSEAPYTRSSVATLLSAHSWRDHGVLSSDDALAGHFTTLAELFRENGWTTLAISDNSNVARSAGSAQGFDEFVQAWSDLPWTRDAGENWWWPERPVRAWEERLDRGLAAERPVFAYLHLMPPHEPYFPGPENDRFGPEGYDGPVTGITPDIRAFDRGEYAPDGPDHERLVALYDGALRRGDALVDRALRAWRATGRERPTLVVFASDHGEAFGEHGRYGHNSSVHEEMNHVPVILWPRGLVPEALRRSPDALRSLGDLLPLLVATTGLELLAGTVWPRRVLEVIEDPARPRSEVFLRCGTPRYGRRTADGLWIYQANRTQSVFDLVRDPAAGADLRAGDAARWLEGFTALRGFLAHPLPAGGAVPAELSDEDRERLRALGYTGGR